MAAGREYSSNVLVDAFWDSVEKGPGCWEWQGTRQPRGYGYFSVGTRWLLAHRAAYAMTHGPVPAELVVRHKCDNPRCVRPDHLELGTVADNVADRERRGRANREPAAEARRKLTEEQVRAIRVSGETGRTLARRFGVTPATITNVRRGHLYRGVS